MKSVGYQLKVLNKIKKITWNFLTIYRYFFNFDFSINLSSLLAWVLVQSFLCFKQQLFFLAKGYSHVPIPSFSVIPEIATAWHHHDSRFMSQLIWKAYVLRHNLSSTTLHELFFYRYSWNINQEEVRTLRNPDVNIKIRFSQGLQNNIPILLQSRFLFRHIGVLLVKHIIET